MLLSPESFKISTIDHFRHFTVVYSVTWPLNDSDDGGDLGGDLVFQNSRGKHGSVDKSAETEGKTN